MKKKSQKQNRVAAQKPPEKLLLEQRALNVVLNAKREIADLNSLANDRSYLDYQAAGATFDIHEALGRLGKKLEKLIAKRRAQKKI